MLRLIAAFLERKLYIFIVGFIWDQKQDIGTHFWSIQKVLYCSDFHPQVFFSAVIFVCRYFVLAVIFFAGIFFGSDFFRRTLFLAGIFSQVIFCRYFVGRDIFGRDSVCQSFPTYIDTFSLYCDIYLISFISGFTASDSNCQNYTYFQMGMVWTLSRSWSFEVFKNLCLLLYLFSIYDWLGTGIYQYNQSSHRNRRRIVRMNL